MWRNETRLFRVWAICGSAGRFDFLSRKLSLIVFISAFWAMRRRVNVFDIWNSDLILIFAEHNEYNGWWKPENQNRLNFIEFKNRQCYKNEFSFGIEHSCLPCLLYDVSYTFYRIFYFSYFDISHFVLLHMENHTFFGITVTIDIRF